MLSLSKAIITLQKKKRKKMENEAASEVANCMIFFVN